MKQLLDDQQLPGDDSEKEVRELVLDQHLPALLTWINNKFSADASRLFRRKFGIGIADWRVIAFLGVHSIGTSAEMSEFLGMDKAAVSRCAAFLQERGLIRVYERNGRSVSFCLSEAGNTLYRRMLKIAFDREARLMTGLKPEEIELLLRLLNRLHSNLPLVYAYSDQLISDDE